MSEPIRYVDRLKAHYEIQGFPPYSWTINEDTPMRRLDKALSECRVSMLTSGGVSSCSAPVWNPHARNDFRLDAVDGEPESDVFQIHDAYYDHGDADRDLNCVFPIDRLRELAAEGFVGAVAPRLWSGFMGRIYKRRAVIEEHAPALASELASDEVDLFLLVPAWPLDHQTMGLVARVVEKAGIPTVLVSTGRDLTTQVRPPRSIFVNFPMGNPFGRPGDTETQRKILLEALRTAERCDEPGLLIDLPYDWGEPFGTIMDSAS